MPIHNADIAAVFDEIADLLEVGYASPFRVWAYRETVPYAAALVRRLQGASGVKALRPALAATMSS